MESERFATNEQVGGSSPLALSNFSNHFGVVQPPGRIALDNETKVQILSPKPNFSILGVPQTAKQASFGKKCSQVRILPPRLNFS